MEVLEEQTEGEGTYETIDHFGLVEMLINWLCLGLFDYLFGLLLGVYNFYLLVLLIFLCSRLSIRFSFNLNIFDLLKLYDLRFDKNMIIFFFDNTHLFHQFWYLHLSFRSWWLECKLILIKWCAKDNLIFATIKLVILYFNYLWLSEDILQ
jgi:hypothetical protein